MKVKNKTAINSFIDGMSSFDIMPSFRFPLKPLSFNTAFSQVGKSFSNVGGIMYQIIETEKKHNETTRCKKQIR